MPLINDISNLPPLNVQLGLDASPFIVMDDAFANLDRRLPAIVANIERFEASLFRIVELARNFNLQTPEEIRSGTAFPIGGRLNVQFPSSFAEDEGLLEASSIGREFFYGGNFPGFFNTFLGRGLLGAGGLGAAGVASQFLPDSLVRSLEFSSLLEDLDIQIDRVALTDAVATGIEEGFSRVAGETVAGRAYEESYPVISAARHAGAFPATSGILSRLRGGSFLQGVRTGTGYQALFHALYPSEGDLRYAQENDLGLFQSSLRRAIPNAFGRDRFSDFSLYDLLPAGTRGIVNLAGNYLYPPAEAGELPDALGEVAIRARRNILPGISIGSGFDLNQYVNQGRGISSGLFSRYVLGDDRDLSGIRSFSDLRNLLEGSRLSRASAEIGGLTGSQLVQSAFAISDDPAGFGRRVGQVENVQRIVQELASIAGEGSELQSIFSDIDEDLQRVLDGVEDFANSGLNLFERLEVSAGRLNENFEGLEEAADSIGESFANAFAQVAFEGRNLEDVLSSVLQNIRNELVNLFIVNPISQIASSITSNVVGSLGVGVGVKETPTVVVNQNFPDAVTKSELAPFSQNLKADVMKEFFEELRNPVSFFNTEIKNAARGN